MKNNLNSKFKLLFQVYCFIINKCIYKTTSNHVVLDIFTHALEY